MFSLALSILFSSFIFVIFKLYTRFKVQTSYAIIVNYVVACSVGLLFYEQSIDPVQILKKNWLPGAIAMGVLFILIFNIMALTSQKLGVSVASVATKMSLVIPVVLGLMLYNEPMGLVKGIGVILALAAVYFASVKEGSTHLRKEGLLLPLLVFLGSGIIDASLKYMEERKVPEEEFPLFSALIFASAALTGFIFIGIKAVKKPLKLNSRNLMGGVLLGVPNYFSIYFLLKALQSETLTSAAVFTINNVAIVMFSTLLGILLFKEYVSPKNWGGIALAVISILLVALF